MHTVFVLQVKCQHHLTDKRELRANLSEVQKTKSEIEVGLVIDCMINICNFYIVGVFVYLCMVHNFSIFSWIIMKCPNFPNFYHVNNYISYVRAVLVRWSQDCQFLFMLYNIIFHAYRAALGRWSPSWTLRRPVACPTQRNGDSSRRTSWWPSGLPTISRCDY